MILSCIVSCIVYINSDQFNDACRMNVKRIYASENYYYVTPTDGKYIRPAANVTVMFKGQTQAIYKHDCKEIKK